MVLQKTKKFYQFGSGGDIQAILREMNQFVNDVHDDIIRIFPSIYTTLPTATKEMRGLFAIKEAAATDDELYFCILNAADGYEWKLVTFT